MFKAIVRKQKPKVGRPRTRFYCPEHDRGFRTEQGLKTHMTRMHVHDDTQRTNKELVSMVPKHTEGKGMSLAEEQLREARARIAHNIERLQGELGEIDQAIETIKKHLGED